jgi:succinate dehydrogenase / fumarate reductase flavoprotein subunit/fumarate reductase flavoprotein subunit
VDLATAPVSVAPAAHIGIGGIVIDEHGRTALPGLLAAGEDAGGVHGASWAGGNGIAESTVFGRRAGRAAAAIARERPTGARSTSAVVGVLARAFDPLTRPEGPGASPLATRLGTLLWERLGLRRDASGLAIASEGIAELRDRALDVGVAGTPAQNGAWQDALDLGSRLMVAHAAVASAATRTESRGVHIRADNPARDDARWLRSVVVRQVDRDLAIDTIPIVLDRLTPAPSPTAPADRALP